MNWTHTRPATLLRLGKSLLLVIAAAFVGAADEVQESAKGTLLNESELAALLDELDETFGALTSVRTEFVQEKHLAIFQDVVKCQGILYFEKPGRVRFEIVKPFRSVLIANGKSVAQYEFIGGAWEKLRSGGREGILTITGQIASWLQGQFRQNDDVYAISARRGARTSIVLTPKDQGLAEYIRRIDIALDKSHSRIERLEIHEPSGDYTVIVFTENNHNVELPPGLFRTSGQVPAQVADIVPGALEVREDANGTPGLASSVDGA